MRTFVGIELDDDMRGFLARVREAVCTADLAWCGDKWTAEENLHVTVKFLGELTESGVTGLARSLRLGLAALEPFDLRLSEPAHAVPNVRRATMLWATLADIDGSAALLASIVGDAAALQGVAPDARDFRPHITLVRARRPRPFRPSERLHLSSMEPVGLVSVGAVSLFRSTLTKHGPVYEVLDRITLGSR